MGLAIHAFRSTVSEFMRVDWHTWVTSALECIRRWIHVDLLLRRGILPKLPVLRCPFTCGLLGERCLGTRFVMKHGLRLTDSQESRLRANRAVPQK